MDLVLSLVSIALGGSENEQDSKSMKYMRYDKAINSCNKPDDACTCSNRPSLTKTIYLLASSAVVALRINKLETACAMSVPL